jgi:ParB family chromosome partitioning protein
MAEGMMARKNLLAHVAGPNVSETEPPKAPPPGPPAGSAGEMPTPTISKRSAFGSIGRSLDSIADKAEEARKISQLLEAGQTIVQLDPDDVDSSFISDRLGTDEEDDAVLLSSIRERGQDAPILVRPHPAKPGKYQAAYGHRRLRAARTLGIKVKAVVRSLTDAELVVAQGQENAVRADLSYIERALFASTLLERGFDKDTTRAALGADPAALSRFLSVVQKIPPAILQAVGRAPRTGRYKWIELADGIGEPAASARARRTIDSEAFKSLSSDERVDAILQAIRAGDLSIDKSNAGEAGRGRPQRSGIAKSIAVWATPEGRKLARISATPEKTTLTLDNREEPEFGSYVASNLDRLYEEFKKQRG